MLWLLLAVPLCVTLHLAIIALAAKTLGVTVREISIGLGPTVLQGSGFRLGLIPISGNVRLRSTQEEDVPASELRSTLEGASTATQLAVVLSGCLTILALASAASGMQALQAFLALPAQVLEGAASPLGHAQDLLLRTSAFLREAPAVLILSLVAAKFAALNLLPLPTLNGGAALAILGRATGIARNWPQAATKALLLAWLALLALWVLALTARLSGA